MEAEKVGKVDKGEKKEEGKERKDEKEATVADAKDTETKSDKDAVDEGKKEDKKDKDVLDKGEEDTKDKLDVAKKGNDSVPSEAPSSDVPVAKDAEEDDELDEAEAIGLLQHLLQGLGVQDREPQKVTAKSVLGEDVSVEGIAKLIQSGEVKNVIVMSGAGISVGAGIPDFRTPGTGLYDNLQKYNLPYPTAVFELDYFLKNPKPFYLLAKELYPGNFKATLAHHFVKLLHDKGVLLRAFTQNIDTLELAADIPEDKLVFAHGSFATAHCVECKEEHSREEVKQKVFADEIPKCRVCKGLVKPDIVFFGENLPERFFKLAKEDFAVCDLLIVIGTSLQVHPFASLIHKVDPSTPRLLINNEIVGAVNKALARVGYSEGFMFGLPQNLRDVALIGDCEDGVQQLAELLGWKDDLFKLLNGPTTA